MTVLELTRLQFAVVTIYHYLFVPLSISLAALTAGAADRLAAYRQRRPALAAADAGRRQAADRHLRGRRRHRAGAGVPVRLSAGALRPLLRRRLRADAGDRGHARVLPRGHVPGAVVVRLGPAAPPRCTWPRSWIVAVGTLLSAFIILAANSFMQNPVAYALDPVTGRARLGDFTDLLTNEVILAAFPHTIAGAVDGRRGAAAGDRRVPALALGRRRRDRALAPARARRGLDDAGRRGGRRAHRRPPRQGHDRGAADEDGRRRGALRDHDRRAVLALRGRRAGRRRSRSSASTCPWLLSFLAKGDPTATVQGIDDLQAQYVAQFGPGGYVPMIPVAFWTFRLHDRHRDAGRRRRGLGACGGRAAGGPLAR